MIPVSGRLWKSSGRESCHSMNVGWWVDERTARCATRASHKIKINMITATIEIIDPIEETMFHLVYASG